MQRTRKHRENKQKKFLIIGSLSLLLFLCIGYAAFSTNLNITAKGNIKEKTRVIQAWDGTSQTDFHSDFYRQNIVSVTFLDNNQVPNNVAESWNVSEDKEHGGVMAWVVPNSSDSTKYDLYIGAKGGVIANKMSNHIFAYFINLTEINFNNNFDTSNVVNLEGMFFNCISLTSVDLSSFNTSNVTSTYALFSMWDYKNQSNLTTIDLSGWDTSQITNMRDMFAYNPNLTTIIGLEKFDTSNVTNMQGVFMDSFSLTNLDLSRWNTSKVTTMYEMFTNCSSLKELNLCSFNTLKVTSMFQMFAGTSNLSVIYVGPNWVTSQANTTNIFGNSGVSSVTTDQC